MTCKKEIIDRLYELFPREDALSYDNVGVLAGDISGSVSKVMIALDVRSSVIDEAASKGCELLITHHPLIFGGIKNISCDNATGDLLWKMASKELSYAAVHTNLDVADEHSNAVLAGLLGCPDGGWTAPETVDCGVFYELSPVTLREFSDMTLKALGGTGVIYYDDPLKVCSRIFVQGGSFDEESIPTLRSLGVDTLVSGEIKHHIMNELSEYGISGIIAGHRETERVFMPHLASLLKESFPGVEFLVSL